jgi:lipoprotein NlpI
MIVHAFIFVCLAQAPTSTDLLEQARDAWANKDLVRAADLANKAIAADPKNTVTYMFRGALHEEKEAYIDAVRDWSKVVELDPKESDAYQARGCLYFKMGNFTKSLTDFDQYLKLRPDRQKSHWQRGITCYYAGKYAEGKRQFEVYQDFDSADVENAVWRFMCMVRADGLKKAQADMLKIGDDRRVPMRIIYDLYIGKKTTDDVLAAASKGEGEAKNRQLFYAHLYLGIWFDLLGEKAKALDHLNKATDGHRISHYMWDVGRVHRDLLAKEKK